MEFWDEIDAEEKYIYEDTESAEIPHSQPVDIDESSNTPGTDNANKSSNVKKIRLTPKQQLMIQNYTDPGKKDTFGNKTNSYEKVYNPIVTNRDDLTSRASQAFRSKPVQIQLEQIMRETQTSSVDRIRATASILHSEYRKKRIYKDSDGEITRIEEETVSPGDMLKAVDILNKMDGTYTKQELKKEIARDEYRDFRKMQLRAMRDATRSPQTEISVDESIESADTEPASTEVVEEVSEAVAEVEGSEATSL